MRTSDRYEIEICLAEIRGRMPDVVWAWDEGKQLVVARLSARQARRCGKILGSLFLDRFGMRQLKKSPDPVRAIVEAYGGLRASQRVWIADVRRECGVFVFWWPWNDGENVSLRIGLYSRGATRVEDREILSSMRGIFAVH